MYSQKYGYGASVLWPEVIIRLVMEVYELDYDTVSCYSGMLLY